MTSDQRCDQHPHTAWYCTMLCSTSPVSVSVGRRAPTKQGLICSAQQGTGIIIMASGSPLCAILDAAATYHTPLCHVCPRAGVRPGMLQSTSSHEMQPTRAGLSARVSGCYQTITPTTRLKESLAAQAMYRNGVTGVVSLSSDALPFDANHWHVAAVAGYRILC